MPNAEARRRREKRVVKEMIILYCRNHHQAPFPCPSCAELIAYAHTRSDRCPFMESKTFCSNCTTHCYKADMRDRIRQVMRYAGPRMIKTHPVMAIRHLIESRIERSSQR